MDVIDIEPNKIYEFPSTPETIKIERIKEFIVLRDDLMPGGTKRRILNSILKNKMSLSLFTPLANMVKDILL